MPLRCMRAAGGACAGLVGWYVLALFTAGAAADEALLWAQHLDGAGAQTVRCLRSDGAGGVYAAGEFSGAFDANREATVRPLTPEGTDVFVLRLDARGRLHWSGALGGPGDDRLLAMAAGAAGEVYVAGRFEGTADLDPGEGTWPVNAAAGDLFVLKLTADGTLAWAGQFDADGIAAAAPRAGGGVYLVGQCRLGGDLDPGAGVLPAGEDDTHGYVLEIGGDGALVAARVVGGGLNTLHGADVDDAGRVYLCGAYVGDPYDPGKPVPWLDFETDTPWLEATIQTDGFVASYTPDFDLRWARQVTGLVFQAATGIEARAGNVVVGGEMTGATRFDAAESIVDVRGDEDAFLLRLSDGGVYQGAYTLGGSRAACRVTACALDDGGTAYAAGSVAYGSVDLGPASAGGPAMFLLATDPAAGPVAAHVFPGDAACNATGVVPADGGGCFVAGYFIGTVDLDPGAATHPASAGDADWDGFILRLGEPAPPPEAIHPETVYTGDGFSGVQTLLAALSVAGGEGPFAFSLGPESPPGHPFAIDPDTGALYADGATLDAGLRTTYGLVVQVLDGTGQTASFPLAVWVLDTTPPDIALAEPAVTTVPCGAPWWEPGAAAVDNVDGAVGVTVGGDVVESGTPGAVHTVRYTALDAAGNEGAATRPVTTVRLPEAWVDFGWAGPPRGTPEAPLWSLRQGAEAVCDGGTVFLRSGDSAETPRVERPMRVNAVGGPATIGAR